MQENALHKSIESLGKIIHVCLFVYLFLLIFPHTATIRSFAFWVAFLCWIALRFKKKEPFIPLNPINISLLLFIVTALISSIIGMEPYENLIRFKRELFPIFILFLITSTEYESIQKVKNLFIAPVISFALYTSLVVWESLGFDLNYFWDRAVRANMWLDGYGQRGITLIPITLGVSLLMKNSWLKTLLLLVSLVEFVIIAPYSFTPVISICAALLLYALFAQPITYRYLMKGFILAVFFMTFIGISTYHEHPAVAYFKNRLTKAIHPIEEISKIEGFSERTLLWDASIDVIKASPVFGYGWGIKKLKKIMYEEQFLDKWKTTKPHIYNFLMREKERFLPPHNIFVEIGVQSGLLGVVTFIVFIGTYVFYLVRTIKYKNTETDCNFTVLIGGTILSFMIMNLMNNELGNISGEILFVTLGVGAAWIKVD